MGTRSNHPKPPLWIPGRRSHNLWRGNILYLPLWGRSNRLIDVSGRGHHGTLANGGPEDWRTVDVGAAIQVNRDIEIVSLANDTDIIALPVTYEFTLVICGSHTISTAGKAVAAWGGTDDLLFYPFDNTGGNGPHVFWRDCGGTLIKSANAYTDGITHVFTLVCHTSSDLRLYVDGVETDSASPGAGAGPFNSFRLLGWTDTVRRYRGTLSLAALWDRALTAGEVVELAQDPFCMIRPPSFAPFWDVAGAAPSGLSIPIAMHHYEMLRN